MRSNPCYFERTHFFSGEGGAYFKGRLLQILSLRRGANAKRGAYLKLGTNSSIYGKWNLFFWGNRTLGLSLFHRKLLLKTHGQERGNPLKNWTPKVATPPEQSYWPCLGQRTGDYRQLQQLLTKANKTKVKHWNEIASSIVLVLYNRLKQFPNLIGSYLWSIWSQTHGWRH